jgi:hypothetical protein
MEQQTINQETMNQEILAKLNQMQIDINVIKQNTVDMDGILTPEEEARHEESLVELERGETVSHEDLKKELGL